MAADHQHRKFKRAFSLAEAKGVSHIVGLQRRMGPSARYTRDLVKQGYVGKIRGVHMTVSTDAFVPTMPGRSGWAFRASNFSHVLSIYAAHFGDMLFRSVGFPRKLTAVIETQFPFFTVLEAGEQVPNTNPNEVMAIGTLESGGLLSMQVEGAQKHCTGLHIDISGTEGVLRITNPLAFQNKNDNAIEGMNGEARTFSPLPIPEKYESLAKSGLDASAQDLAYLYAAYASDKKNGTSEASNFYDAVRQHHLIDEIYKTSEEFCLLSKLNKKGKIYLISSRRSDRRGPELSSLEWVECARPADEDSGSFSLVLDGRSFLYRPEELDFRWLEVRRMED